MSQLDNNSLNKLNKATLRCLSPQSWGSVEYLMANNINIPASLPVNQAPFEAQKPNFDAKG
jgi:hypothetical protein